MKVKREEGRGDGRCGGKGEKWRGKGQAAKREAVCGERRTTEKTSGESAVHQIAAFTTFAHWPTRKPFMIGSIMFTKQRRRARQGGQGSCDSRNWIKKNINGDTKADDEQSGNAAVKDVRAIETIESVATDF